MHTTIEEIVGLLGSPVEIHIIVAQLKLTKTCGRKKVQLEQGTNVEKKSATRDKHRGERKSLR